MQRKSIRATVGADDIDIPIHSFLPNQTLVYEGGAIVTAVRVKVVGTPTTGNLASWFNAETIQDSGLLVTDIVRNPGTSVTRQIAVFSDTTGKAIAAAPVQVDVAGALTLVTNINGRAVDSFVVGPASAVNGNLVSFNGTTGKLVQDAGVLPANLVTSTSTPTINQVVTWTGTGKNVQNVTVTIVGGALTNVATINTIDPATWVVGPASVVNGNLASFNGTTGKLVQDAGVLPANLVTSVSTPVANQVVTWTGTGKAVQNATVKITAFDISLVDLINGKICSDLVTGPSSAGSSNLAAYSSTTGKVLLDSGILSTSVVVGPASATTNNVASYNGTTGKLIKDSGVLATNLVTTSASPSADQLATFTGTGKAIQNNTATVVGGALAGLTSINAAAIATYVTVPGGVTTDNIPAFSGTGFGKQMYDSGVSYTNLLTRTGAPVTNQIAVWTSTSNVVGASVVTINAGAIANVVSINTIAIGRYIFTDGSTFSGNDMPVLTGSGFAPRQTTSDFLGAQTVSTTSVEPSPWRFIATRAGNYSMTWDFCISLGDTSSSVEVKVFWSSGTGKAYCTFTAAGTLTFTTSGTASSFALTGTTPPVMGCRCVLTVTGASAACNMYMMFRKTGGVSYSILDGGLGTLREKD